MKFRISSGGKVRVSTRSFSTSNRGGVRVRAGHISAGRGGVRASTYGPVKLSGGSGGFRAGVATGAGPFYGGVNGSGGFSGVSGSVSTNGFRVWHGVHAPKGHYWVPDQSKVAGARLVSFTDPGPAASIDWRETSVLGAWFIKHQDFEFAPFFRHPVLVAAVLIGRFVTMIRDASNPSLPIL